MKDKRASVLFVTNIPSPYRVDFYSLLGQYVDLTVIFEARGAEGIQFDYRQEFSNFHAIFLSDGAIQEKKVDFRILSLIKRKTYDYVFLTNYGYATELVAYLKCVFANIDFVLEVDGGTITEEGGLKKWLKTFLLTKPKAYFSPSQTTDAFFSHFGADKQKMIRYHFTSLKESDVLAEPLSPAIKREKRAELGLLDLPTILFVGRLIPSKGVDRLLQALKQLTRPVQCLIIGDSSDEAHKEYLYDLASGIPNLHFKGFLPTAELTPYFQLSDVFVFPTKKDVWGLVINEALANGLPVLSTKEAVAAVELIKDGYNGYLLSDGEDIQTMAAVIEQTLYSDSLEELSCNSLLSIKEYTIEEMVRQHLDYMGVKHEDFDCNDDL